MAYNTRLTKEELIKSGITNITEDGKIFRNGKEIKPFKLNSGYYIVNIYTFDENGDKIIVPTPDTKQYYTTKDGLVKSYTYASHYSYKSKAVGVHRLVYTWFHNETPEGYCIDHINDDKADNRLSNLQLLTPQDNINKNKRHNIRIMKCKLNKDRSFYENKLNEYLALYEEAKANKDRIATHKWRTYVSQYKARLRYYDLNKRNNIKFEVKDETLIIKEE